MKNALILLSLLSVAQLSAAELGMEAPTLKVAAWIKGNATTLDKGRVSNAYVLFFWETGCPHCLESIPELSELQTKYRQAGLTVLGISPESAEAVSNFLQKTSAKIDFAVAVDNARKTHQAYMTSFGKAAVPYTFIVGKDGRIIWHRHPMAGLRAAVDQIMSGTYDFAAEKRAEGAELLSQQYVAGLRNSLDPGRFEFESLSARILSDGSVNPWLLNNFACDILSVTNLPKSAMELALRASKLAYETTGQTNSAFADSYAHALFASGKTAEAVTMQKRAIELSTDPRYRPYLEKALETFQAKQKESSK